MAKFRHEAQNPMPVLWTKIFQTWNAVFPFRFAGELHQSCIGFNHLSETMSTTLNVFSSCPRVSVADLDPISGLNAWETAVEKTAISLAKNNVIVLQLQEESGKSIADLLTHLQLLFEGIPHAEGTSTPVPQTPRPGSGQPGSPLNSEPGRHIYSYRLGEAIPKTFSSELKSSSAQVW